MSVPPLPPAGEGERADWLSNLPHQIPFRAASAVRRRDADTIEGVFVCTANDPVPSGVMLLEAMAQYAGGIAFKQQAFLTGMDRCEVRCAIEPGSLVLCRVTKEVEFGGTVRFSAVGFIEELEVARGRFYLALPPSDATP